MTGDAVFDAMDQWPSCDLQDVAVCPVCGAGNAGLHHEAVRDWSFWCTPGQWSYWHCPDCESVYLNPRPTPASIGRAYDAYYTHASPIDSSGVRGLKMRWKNERLSARFKRNMQPRLQLPHWMLNFVGRRAKRMVLPFGWDHLAALPPGKLIDVGSGSGALLQFARQLGWQVEGVEFDPLAVAAARAAALSVHQGGYEALWSKPEAFDVVSCFHVIEHVHDPLDMMQAIHGALRSGGVLLLATPNVLSDVHRYFGKYWRGLEAPRHLVLFSELTLTRCLQQFGFAVESCSDWQLETVQKSIRIASGKKSMRPDEGAVARRIAGSLSRTASGHDFIKLRAVKV